MFKKERDLAERSRTLLKNKEVRSFKSSLLQQLQNISEDELNAVIPNKASITLTKLATKTLLYSIENVVIAFDVGGRGSLFPALSFVWKFPLALPCFTIHSAVSEFVMKGADLMIPGLGALQGLEGLQLGDKVAVRVRGNPLPFAVGVAAVGWEALAVKGQRKGVAMTVHHLYGDLITPSGSVPNAGFGTSCIYAIASDTRTASGANDYDDNDDDDDDGDASAASDKNDDDDDDEATATDAAHGSGDTEATEIIQSGHHQPLEQSQDQQMQQQQQIMQQDEALIKALVLASKYIVKQQQLPMLVSTFWSTVQRCAAEAGDELPLLDIKKSSHKKVSTFLRHCNSSAGFLKLKEEHGVSTVTSIDRAHEWFTSMRVSVPDVEAFKTAVTQQPQHTHHKMQEEAREQVTSDFAAIAVPFPCGGGGGGGKKQQQMQRKNDSKIQVLELFKLTKHLRDVFGSVRGVYGDFLRPSEVRDLLVMHINSQGLENSQDKATVVLNPIDSLYRMLASALVSAVQQPTVASRGNEGSDDDSKPASCLKSAAAAASLQKQHTHSGGIRWSESVVGQDGGDDDEEEDEEDEEGELQEADGEVCLERLRARSSKAAAATRAWEAAYGAPISSCIYNTNAPHTSANGDCDSGSRGGGSSEVLHLNIRAGGLMPSEELPLPPPIHHGDDNSSRGGSGVRGKADSFPVLGSTAAQGGGAARISGGSCVGGWGVDKGTAWKPVSLSSRSAVPRTTPSTSNNSPSHSKGNGVGKGAKGYSVGARPSSAASSQAFPVLGNGGNAGACGGGVESSTSSTTAAVASVNGAIDTVAGWREQEEQGAVVVRKDAFFKAVLSKMSPYFAVVSPNGSYTVHNGQSPKVKILVETRMGNKTVTLLRGLDVFGLQQASLVKECQKKFACSVALSGVPGIPKEKEVVLQGNFAYEVESFLCCVHGVPKHCVELAAGKGAKLKRKK